MKRGKYIRTVETRAKNRAAFLGTKLPESTKQKISESHARLAGEKNGNWKGGISFDEKGYRCIYRGGGKYIKEHRLVITNLIGRSLLKKETVHHWDEDKKNNSLENLALLRSESAHQRLHNFAKRHGLQVEILKFSQPWLSQ